MKPSVGSAYVGDDSFYHNTVYSFHIVNRGHHLKRFVINIRASKKNSGLVQVTVTSPAGLMKFFLKVDCFYLFISTVLIYGYKHIYDTITIF